VGGFRTCVADFSDLARSENPRPGYNRAELSGEVEGTGPGLAAGDVVGGKYTIACVVGEGGMGVVYEARHERLGQKVALKVLRSPDEAHHDEIIARFEREARAAARLKSSHVARVYDVDQLADGTPYMVMEYLHGVDLDAELRQRVCLPVDEAVNYVLQACSAVAEAHSLGVIHRDLKPHNLFLVGEGAQRQVKLLDFGISKISDEAADSVTLTRSSLGTPLYMSPEQIRSSRTIDARSDIWSLGVILYELITGRPPFEGEGPTAVIAAITADALVPPNELSPQIPQTLSDAIVRALQKDASQRFQSVQEFAEAIMPYGPIGAWSEPLVGSSPSNPRISIPDAITVRADAATILADSSGSNVPIALTPTPRNEETPRSRRLLLVAFGVVAVAAALGGFLLSRSTSSTAEVAAPSVAASVEEVEARVATKKPEVAPAPQPEVAVAPAVSAVPSSSASPSATAKPRPRVVRRPPPPPKPTASAAKTEKPPAPPPPPAENPLHL